MSDVRRRTTCRLCRASNLSAAFSLVPTPLANAFRSPNVPAASQARYPLDVLLCDRCGHLQLGHVVDASTLFADYLYVSGTSNVFVRHFEEYAKDLIARLDDIERPKVVEIGSNDGTLLSALRSFGADVQGVDPAHKIATSAIANGIPTKVGFFDTVVAQEILKEKGPVDVVVANNVCAHIDNLESVVASVAELLSVDGMFVFEVSYRKSVMEKTLFDTIYHEHLDYHAVRPLVTFLERHGLRMIDVQTVATHGGSIRVYAAPKGTRRPVDQSVGKLIMAEEKAGLFDLATYTNFYKTIMEAGEALRQVIKESAESGRKMAGYGAPAKATTLMFQFGLNSDMLRYVVDDSPWKQDLMCPGLDVPVVSRETLARDPVDDVLILAWNFADSIIDHAKPLMKPGARAIVPLPELKVQSL